MDLNSKNYPFSLLEYIRNQLRLVYNVSSEELDKVLYHQLMEDDYLLSRYIRRKHGDAELSISSLVSTLQWRKKNGISELSESSFPSEFYEVGGIYVFKEDVNGNVVLYVRLALFQKVSEILESLKKFTVFLMYKADEKASKKSKGWIILMDCTGAGIVNADIEMASFLNSTLRNYFPHGQLYVLIVNLSWILNAIKSVVMSMLPAHVRKRIKFCSSENITSFIPFENLPDHLGGPATAQEYRMHPKNLLNTSEMVANGSLKLTQEQLDKVNKYYEKLRESLLNK